MPTILTVTLSSEAFAAFTPGTSKEPIIPPHVLVEVRYAEDVRPEAEQPADTEAEVVPRTVRVTISGVGSTTIDVGSPVGNKLSIALLKSDGSTVREHTVTMEGNKAKYAITITDIKELIKAEADPVAVTSMRVMRNAQFVPIGSVTPDFKKSQLAIFTVNKDTEIAANSPLGSFGFSKDRTSSVELDPALATALQGVTWASVSLGIDGRFVALFDQPLSKPGGDAVKSLGWVWWLSGDRSAAGFVKDDVSQVDRSTKIIPLPAMQPLPGTTGTSATDCDCDAPAKQVSLDVSEAELVNNPDIYAEDPGTFCKPFSNPNRVVSEKSFAVVSRVVTPDISPLGSSRLRSTHLLDLEPDDEVTVGTDPRDGIRVVQLPSREVMLASMLRTKKPMRYKETPAVVQQFKEMPSGRTEVSAEQPVQWEDDMAQYQAATVALGHILEFRVRTRSAGYSLGNVASTLTLAPRQTKRIQKVEFERVERARREERTQQADSVSDEVRSERDYNDTVSAYLSEWATGSSSSGTAAAAGGFGFCIPPVVGGVGGGTSSAWSESSQEGARHTGASEQQRLRDSIRRHGDALRRFQSTVVSEVTQQETVTGTTEVLRNVNYGHSLTVIYYQILRHLSVSTEFAGVRECLYVPFAVKPFTLQRAYRWREAIQKHLRISRYAKVMTHLRDVVTDFKFSNMEVGTRANQRLTYLRGSFYINLAIERPKDTDDGKYNAAQWLPYSSFFGVPAYGIWAKLAEKAEALRDQLFQREHAPTIAAKWTNKLTIRINGKPVEADLTLATRYGFNQSVRVDFNVDGGAASGYTRAQLVNVKVEANVPLPPGSVANVTRMTIRYGTANFQRTIEALSGTDDLIMPETGAKDDRGAQLTFPLDAWDNVNEREVLRNSVNEFIEHLNEHVEFYHKAIWWSMDRDRLLMMLDGFYVPGSKSVSIASVVDREPIAIIGNSLVYRVGAGHFIGLPKVTKPSELYNLYAGREPAQDDLRISLPTDGLYAQTIMDECLALEEHQGSVDWVLNDPDPELGTIDPSLMMSRRADVSSTLTPTQMPSTIINLQNAPDAPAPTGLGGALSAVGNAGAFRDMAGLAGTQANAAAALQTAASLATNFGNQAAALKMAEMAKSKQGVEDVNKKLAAINKAHEQGAITDEQRNQQYMAALSDMNAQGESASEQAGDGLEQHLLNSGQEGSMTTVTPTGARSMSIKPVFGSAGGDAADAGSSSEVIYEGELLAPVDDEGNPIAEDGDSISDVVYGGYDLKEGDKDSARRWGGAVRNTADDMGNTPPQGAKYIKQLQADLLTVGIKYPTANGVFDSNTKFAVREFQIYSGMEKIAELTSAGLGANPPARYRDSLQQVVNSDQYQGRVTGEVNDETRRLLTIWLTNNYRIPVVIEAWRMNGNSRMGTTPVKGNLWKHDDDTDDDHRIFVTDLSEYYEPRIIDTEVLGTYASGSDRGGGNAKPPNHTKAEVLPDSLIGSPLSALTPEQLSTFKVLRAVADTECYGYFDGINCWDDQTVSIPLHHGTLGTLEDRGELGAYLTFFQANDIPGYERAFGRFGLNSANDILGPGSRRHVANAALSSANGFTLVGDRTTFRYLKSWHWFNRWVHAGRSVVEHQQMLYSFAKRRLRLLLETPWPSVLQFDDGSGARIATLGDVFTSERSRALLLRWHVNMPGHVVSNGSVAQPIRNALATARQNAPNDFKGANVALWTAASEDELVSGIMLSRANTAGAPSLTTMNPVRDWPSWSQANNSRNYSLPLTIGPLSAARGSMLLDP